METAEVWMYRGEEPIVVTPSGTSQDDDSSAIRRKWEIAMIVLFTSIFGLLACFCLVQFLFRRYRQSSSQLSNESSLEPAEQELMGVSHLPSDVHHSMTTETDEDHDS